MLCVFGQEKLVYSPKSTVGINFCRTFENLIISRCVLTFFFGSLKHSVRFRLDNTYHRIHVLRRCEVQAQLVLLRCLYRGYSHPNGIIIIVPLGITNY